MISRLGGYLGSNWQILKQIGYVFSAGQVHNF